MHLPRRTRAALVALAAAATLGAGACGEDDVDRAVDEGARKAKEAGRDAGKAAKDAGNTVEKGAKDAKRKVDE